jgi:hypothetical protein
MVISTHTKRSRKVFRLMRASRMDLMTFAEALEAFARLS